MRQLVGVFGSQPASRKTETSFGIHIPQEVWMRQLVGVFGSRNLLLQDRNKFRRPCFPTPTPTRSSPGVWR
jgi:hypothetical protein